MVRFRKFFIVITIILLLFILLVVLAMIFLNIVIPLKPQYPYFGSSYLSVAEVNWDIGDIQPFYLWTFKKNNQTFYKTVLRDSNNKIKFVNLLVFTKNENNSDSYGSFISINNNEIDLKKVDVGKIFKFGQRMDVSYLINANNDYLLEENKGLCEHSLNLCKAGEYT